MTDTPHAATAYAFQEHLGYRLTRWADGSARVELPLANYLGNRSNLPHGGVHATLLDTAMGYAGTWDGTEGGRLALTLSLTVNFVGRPKGKILIAEAIRTGGGARSYFSEGRVTDETGVLIATGSGVFRLRGEPG